MHRLIPGSRNTFYDNYPFEISYVGYRFKEMVKEMDRFSGEDKKYPGHEFYEFFKNSNLFQYSLSRLLFEVEENEETDRPEKDEELARAEKIRELSWDLAKWEAEIQANEMSWWTLKPFWETVWELRDVVMVDRTWNKGYETNW